MPVGALPDMLVVACPNRQTPSRKVYASLPTTGGQGARTNGVRGVALVAWRLRRDLAAVDQPLLMTATNWHRYGSHSRYLTLWIAAGSLPPLTEFTPAECCRRAPEAAISLDCLAESLSGANILWADHSIEPGALRPGLEMGLPAPSTTRVASPRIDEGYELQNSTSTRTAIPSAASRRIQQRIPCARQSVAGVTIIASLPSKDLCARPRLSNPVSRCGQFAGSWQDDLLRGFQPLSDSLARLMTVIACQSPAV